MSLLVVLTLVTFHCRYSMSGKSQLRLVAMLIGVNVAAALQRNIFCFFIYIHVYPHCVILLCGLWV